MSQQKDSSQETIISLMGMLAGSLVVSYISSKWATWTAMIFLLAIHLGTNYLAVRAVCMRTLNRQRANLVLSNALEQLWHDDQFMGYTGVRSAISLPLDAHFLSPQEVYLQERIFETDSVLRWNGRVLGYCRLGVNLQTVLECFCRPDKITGSHSGSELLQFSKLFEVFKGCGYIVWYDEPRKTFLVVLGEEAGPITILKAWMFALQFARFGEIKKGQSIIEALENTRAYLASIEGAIMDRIGEKWDLEVSSMETRSGTRFSMKEDKRSGR
jgi:hypothetical protein